MKKDKKGEKNLFVHPMGMTNTFIQGTFDNPETKIIMVDGKNIEVYALTANQVADLDSFKLNEGLRYDVYEGDQEKGYNLRGSKKAHVNPDSAKMIQVLKATKAIPQKDWAEISCHLKDPKGRNVKLVPGDQLIYSKAEKILCAFRSGGALLTCNNSKGITFSGETELLSFIRKFSAMAGLRTKCLDHFEHIIFTIAPKTKTRKK